MTLRFIKTGLFVAIGMTLSAYPSCQGGIRQTPLSSQRQGGGTDNNASFLVVTPYHANTRSILSSDSYNVYFGKSTSLVTATPSNSSYQIRDPAVDAAWEAFLGN